MKTIQIGTLLYVIVCLNTALAYPTEGENLQITENTIRVKRQVYMNFPRAQDEEKSRRKPSRNRSRNDNYEKSWYNSWWNSESSDTFNMGYRTGSIVGIY